MDVEVDATSGVECTGSLLLLFLLLLMLLLLLRSTTGSRASRCHRVVTSLRLGLLGGSLGWRLCNR
jgi:hypothetical protein